VLLSPLFAWLWPWLEKRGRNPSKPMKSAIGLLFAALAFLPLMAAAKVAGGGVMASVWWLVLAYFVLEIGEMCLSPIGLSAVTQLSVARVVGLMMGGFWLATAYSEMLAAEFARDAAPPVRLTPEGWSVNSPAFSSDGGTVYFLSGKSGSSQLYAIPVAGGEPVQVTDFPVGVDGFVLSPDGKRIAFAAGTFPDCGGDLACT